MDLPDGAVKDNAATWLRITFMHAYITGLIVPTIRRYVRRLRWNDPATGEVGFFSSVFIYGGTYQK